MFYGRYKVFDKIAHQPFYFDLIDRNLNIESD